jgi:mono/diheme cytochrome c family protein
MRTRRAALLALIVGVAGAAGAAEPAGGGGAPPAAGDASAGRDLFSGSRPFRNGGAPCGACHALGGEGLAFTASLGPELSASLAPMDAESLDGLLESLPFPTMTPIYDTRVLTPAERRDLVAYLLSAAKQGPPRETWRFELLGVLGAGVLFLGLALAGRRRKPPSRARLLARAHPTNGGSR